MLDYLSMHLQRSRRWLAQLPPDGGLVVAPQLRTAAGRWRRVRLPAAKMPVKGMLVSSLTAAFIETCSAADTSMTALTGCFC